MLVIAHRGANRQAFENSFSAFDAAVQAEAQRIELDVQLTGDGSAVVVHDPNLFHATGHHVHVNCLTDREIRKLKLINQEPIPFLHEVLDQYLDKIEINIEIKGNHLNLAESVAGCIGKLGSQSLCDRLIISSFQWQPLVWFRDHMPEVKRACLLGTDTWSWPYFANVAPNLFLQRIQTNILHPHVSLVTESFMDQARNFGWTVYPWAGMQDEEQDCEALWSTLKTFQVDGLCTNYPYELKIWLAQTNRLSHFLVV